MSTIQMQGAIITDSIAKTIKYLQGNEMNCGIDAHCASLREVSEFLIEKREDISDDKQVLDHIICIRCVIAELERFRAPQTES